MLYDDLLNALRSTGIEFEEESWVSAPESDYGVLARTGAETNYYADDELIRKEVDCEVHLYTRDGGQPQADTVDDAIRALEDVTVHSTQREFMPDWNMMHYSWIVNVLTFED